MNQPAPRIFILLGVFLFICSSALRAATIGFDIPAQPAAAALQLFIKQADTQVMFNPADLKDVRTNAVVGDFEASDALARLLNGTGLTAQEKEGKFTVTRTPAPSQTGSVEGSLLPPPNTQGKSIAGLTVTVNETGDETSTDKYGRFGFPTLAPGTYTLIAYGEGFSHLRIEDVVVQAGHTVVLGAEMMPVVMKNGEVQIMAEVVVRANKDIETMTPVVVSDTSVKPEPFSDRNVDLPRTIDDVQPYYIFDSQTLEESGTTDVEDFLKQRLTMDTTAKTASQTTWYMGSNGVEPGTTSSNINLQGLGTDHTLILVNGLPMAGVAIFSGFGVTAPTQPDVNGIPLAAIDRIEVLPSSAGAIYGASAEGGVINIILKKAYNGGDITATYASTWDGYGPSRELEATFGKSFEDGKTQLFLTAQYSSQTPMFVQDRIGLLNRGYSRLLVTDPAYVGSPGSNGAGTPPVGSEPNFRSSPTGTTLTFKNGASLGSSFGTLPSGYNGNTSTIIPGQWNLSPGEDNEGPGGLLVPLGNYPRRKSIMATLTRQMTSKLELHVDFSNDEDYSYSSYNPINVAGNGGVSLAASAPSNPFNQAIDITFPINYSAPAVSNTTTKAITLGGTLKLPFDWVAHLDYQWSDSLFENDYAGSFSAGFAFPSGANYSSKFNGVTDTAPTPLFTGAINPFVDTIAYPINWAPFTESLYQNGENTSNELLLAASGPLFRLPWGTPRLSIRLEHNKSGEPQGAVSAEEPSATPYPGMPATFFTKYSFGQSQTTDSAKAELDIPIFKTTLPLLRSLDAQLNFSNETTSVGTGSTGYEIFGSYPYNLANSQSTNPLGLPVMLAPNTVSASAPEPFSTGAQPYRYEAVNSNTGITGPALSYQPIDSLIIRASVADGYVPPTYSQLLPSAIPNAGSTTITDPKNPAAGQYGVQTYSGGNPELKPETSKSWDFGVIWEPKSGVLKGLRADAEFTETKQHNLIYSAGTQFIVNNAAEFPSLVVRDPNTGLVTIVYNQPVNVNEAKNDAWNLSVDYNFPTAIGAFEILGAETIEEHDQQQLAQGGPFLEFVGYPNSGGIAKTKATGTLRWALRNWVAAWNVVYFDGYKQFGAPGDPSAYQGVFNLSTYNAYASGSSGYLGAQGGWTIPSQIYHNLYVSYAFRRKTGGPASHWSQLRDNLLDGTKISFSVNNVFNTLPPFDAYYAPFYTSPYGDLQLRNYQVSVKKSF